MATGEDRDGLRCCPDCGEWKPLAEFCRSNRRPDGRGSYCKPCLNLRSKASYAICGAPGPQHVDHDHVFGNVRGVLCFNCNGGLGQFKHNVENLGKAISYLRGTTWQRVLIHPGV